MIFEQFYLASLGHGSYLLGSEATREAVVVDPRRDTGVYFKAARRHGLRIRYALDTHQHNDYVTGLCELPRRDNIELLAAARAELGYQARRLMDGEWLDFGDMALQIMDTPGHTPEHISVMVYDKSKGEQPTMLLSGGALLVGDIGRPDLLGDPEDVRAHARQLGHTLREKLWALPDHVMVYPTHLSGSLCGGNIDSRLSTTLGYERLTNPLLACAAEHPDEFVDQCVDLSRLPAVPPYWRRMRAVNRKGPPLLKHKTPPALAPDAFDVQRRSGAVVLDCRPPEAFAVHIPGALNAGLCPNFPVWAGTLVPYDRPLLLVTARASDVLAACRQLHRIGYHTPVGYLAGGMQTWRMAAKPLATLPQWTVWDLHDRLGRIHVLDVRQPGEWRSARIPGAHWITGAELPRRLDEVDGDQPHAVICGSGYRSSAAASLLMHHDKAVAANVLGGMSAWAAAGLSTDA